MKARKILFSFLTTICFGFAALVITSCDDKPAQHVHKWDSGKTTKEPTCTEEGEKTLTCTGCGEIIIITTSAKGHKEVIDKNVQATCTTTGLTEGKHCSVCNEVLVAQEIIKNKEHENSYICGMCNQINETYYTEGLKFTLLEDGESYSVSSGNANYETEIFIPSIYKGKPITDIGDSAFRYCHKLASITIPDSITSIGELAFGGCWELTNIKIPDGVISIGNNAFSDCSSLTSVTIPDGVTSIGSGVFSGCRLLENITIPNSVTSIGSYAFGSCSGLTSITIPNSVTTIDKRAFEYCSSLESITLPFVGNMLNGTSNTHFGYIFGANYSTDNSSYVPKGLKEVIITGGTSISANAFAGCSSLESITIPDGVTSIGSGAFSGCRLLENITIPDSITSVGNNAFYDCGSLNYNTYDMGLYLGNSNNPYLALVDTKNTSITSININKNTKFILKASFENCSALTSIIIPDSVINIGDSAFKGCSALKSITIPNSITSIGNDAFYDCGSLTYNEYDNGLYLGNENNPYLALVDTKNTSITSININKNTKFILKASFENCGSLTSIIIPDSVTSIGDSAFKGCSSLKSITIPNSITSIGNSVFKDCSSLKSVTIPNSITSIGSSAFSGCISLTSIRIPNSVTSIGMFAFYECSSLESITLPFVGYTLNGTNNTIFGYIFGARSTPVNENSYFVPNSLKKVIITGGTRIDSRAFYNCGSLESITIPDSVTSIGYEAFYGCRSLTSIIISDSVTSIGEHAFEGCSSLESIAISDSVTSISDFAFYNCSLLETVYYTGTEEQWNSIIIGSGNSKIKNAEIYYNYK